MGVDAATVSRWEAGSMAARNVLRSPTMSMDLFRALTSAEKDELGRFLDKTPGAMPFPKAQGFLTAVGSAPSMIMPSDWQPAVLGEPEFESMEDAQR